MEIKKISENIWEIPKERKMNVPGIIFASDVLMESMKKDETINQVKNVAMLPGISGKSLAMPDAHMGYGFSVGGVAAFDVDSGIISPGGVGYDINCLTGDTRILTEFGQSIEIKDFENVKSEIDISQGNRKIKQIQFSEKLKTLNENKKEIENKSIALFMSKESKDVYEIELKSGLKIRATLDHPFLTKTKMKPLAQLNKNDEISVNLFEGIDYEGKIDKKEAILSKVLGYMFGDGTLYESNRRTYAIAYGQLNDLETIKNDLHSIGVNSKIYNRERKHKIKTKYGIKYFETINHELHIHSKEFKELLKERGMPIGNKTRQETQIPEWIKNSSKAIKRLFLAGFFGAELSTPKTSSKTCFFCPTIDQNKASKLRQNARDFLIDITLMLEEFGIKNTKITEFRDHKNKHDEETMRFRLFVKGEKDMIKLWRKIGFEYNHKRQKLADIASLYILLKKQENKKRIEIAKRIKEYRKKGLTIKEVKKLFSGEINERFVERHYYEEAKQRISLDFISFEEFTNEKLQELKNYGVIFDSINKVNKIPGKFKVYDFNVQGNHNFMANCFVVSNCGVRLLSTDLDKEEFLKKRKEFVHQINQDVPSGVGRGGEFKFNGEEINSILEKGVKWLVDKGLGEREDIENCEDSGCILGADASKISQRAKARGKNQLGTLGAGNHFLEIQEIEEIFNEEIAKAFGLEKGRVCVLIHSGSRGLGHQTCSDYIKACEKEYGTEHLPDRELAYAPIKSKLGKDYLGAMRAAANFAFCNRHLIAYQIKKSFKKFFPKKEIRLVYDVAHNIAKFEEFIVDGEKKRLCVHRKGATRSFGPGRKELPKKYQETGQPIFIPGSMGTWSYVLVGTNKAREISFASTAHGAGRLLSRTRAKKEFTIEKVRQELREKDIYIEGRSNKGILEEAPGAYKDVKEVVKVSHELGIGNLVARLRPLGVMKG